MHTQHPEVHPITDGIFHSTSDASNALNPAIKDSATKKVEHALLQAAASQPSVQFTPTVKVGKATKKSVAEDPEYRETYTACMNHVVSLSKGKLAKLYPSEYNSMRGAISRAKGRQFQFDKRLKDIRNWLVHLGPRPHVGYSVDRKNYYKGYEIGNLRWATKHTQTQNRRVTKFHSVPGVGRLSTKALADHLGLSYSTVYKRLRHSWSIERMLAQLPVGVRKWQWPANFAEYRMLYNTRPQKQFLTSPLDWVIDHLWKLIKNASCSDEQQEAFLRGISELEDERTRLLTEENEYNASQLEKLAAPFMPLKIVGFNPANITGVSAVPSASPELALAL